MKSIVRANPALPCGQAVRTVRIQAATEFGNDDDCYKHLVAELGTDAALEKQLLRVRHEVIGPTPRSRIFLSGFMAMRMRSLYWTLMSWVINGGRK